MSETKTPPSGEAKAAPNGTDGNDGVQEAKGGASVTRDAHGQPRIAYRVGRDPFAKISAVEGIAPTQAARARGREFDRLGLSPSQRRKAILDAHRP